jgi:hypothetical protein
MDTAHSATDDIQMQSQTFAEKGNRHSDLQGKLAERVAETCCRGKY